MRTEGIKVHNGQKGRKKERKKKKHEQQTKSRQRHGRLSLRSVVCCQVVVSATGRSPVQRSSTDCGVSLCAIYNLKNEAALARVGLLHQRKKIHWHNIILVILRLNNTSVLRRRNQQNIRQKCLMRRFITCTYSRCY